MNKVYSYLGLARRAGQMLSGEQAVAGGVKRGQVCLILIAEDASSNTHGKFSSLARNYNVRILIYGEKERIGQAIGQSPRAVLGILDRNFANVIQTHVKEPVEEKN